MSRYEMAKTYGTGSPRLPATLQITGPEGGEARGEMLAIVSFIVLYNIGKVCPVVGCIGTDVNT